jgi:hypothetical protein
MTAVVDDAAACKAVIVDKHRHRRSLLPPAGCLRTTTRLVDHEVD